MKSSAKLINLVSYSATELLPITSFALNSGELQFVNKRSKTEDVNDLNNSYVNFHGELLRKIREVPFLFVKRM